jgi:hypothetical protein
VETVLSMLTVVYHLDIKRVIRRQKQQSPLAGILGVVITSIWKGGALA